MINKRNYSSVSKKSMIDANKRRLLCFPNKRNSAIFLAICFKEKKKKSSLMHEMFLSFINRLSEDKKQEYLDLYKTLSEDQIKKIGIKNIEDDGC